MSALEDLQDVCTIAQFAILRLRWGLVGGVVMTTFLQPMFGKKACVVDNKCTCQGCNGIPQKDGKVNNRSPPHSGKCEGAIRKGPQFGSYCKRCYRTYLCIRCLSKGERYAVPNHSARPNTFMCVHSFTPSLLHSFIRPFTHSLPSSFIPSFIHSFTH